MPAGGTTMVRWLAMAVAVAFLGIQAAPAALAQQPVEITVSVKNNKFDPAEIEAPANTPIKLTVKNLDPKPMEFESKTLKVEKVITGNGTAVLNIRAQKPGKYEFFDEYHEDTTRGTLVVK